MLARIAISMLALATLALAVPGPAGPTDTAAAHCYQIDGVDDCFNPCMPVAGAYNGARSATGLEEKTPEAQCPA